MSWFSRSDAATLALTPTSPLRPTETVTATVVVDRDVEKVTTAVVELGYVNAYRYRWAGRRDAAARYDDADLATIGQVGTDAGSDRSTSDWVPALAEALPVVEGRLPAGRYPVALRLPSWSPGSSASLVRWEVRLRIDRDGRDVAVDAPLTVLVPAPDPVPTDLPLVQHAMAMFSSVLWDITTERACYRPGDEIRGVVTMTVHEPTDRTGQLALYAVTERISHPLERTPARTTESMTRPPHVVAEGIRLVPGVPQAIPFAFVLPLEVEPTTEAVHSSLAVQLDARVMFSGLTGGVEHARRAIVVHTG